MAWVLFAQQNTIKTAFRFSIIDFYFVTGFYSLYDICMTRNQNFFKLRTTCKAKAAGGHYCLQRPYWGYPKIQLTS